MNHRWLTVKQVADYLQLSVDLIYRLAQQGKIPVSKVGGRWRFKKDKIDQWMESQELKQQAKGRHRVRSLSEED